MNSIAAKAKTWMAYTQPGSTSVNPRRHPLARGPALSSKPSHGRGVTSRQCHEY